MELPVHEMVTYSTLLLINKQTKQNKKKDMISVGKNVEKLEPSYAAGGDEITITSAITKQSGRSSKG